MSLRLARQIRDVAIRISYRISSRGRMFDQGARYFQARNRAPWIVVTTLAFLFPSICSPPSNICAGGTTMLSGVEAASNDPDEPLSPISIDYPEDGSIFPPGITPPTFLWRDAAGTSWNIEISFADKSAPIHAVSTG